MPSITTSRSQALPPCLEARRCRLAPRDQGNLDRVVTGDPAYTSQTGPRAASLM